VRPRPLAALAAAVLLLGVGLGAERGPGLADVVGVRHWSYDEYTRVVIELSRETDAQVRRLDADSASGRKERLYLDLPDTWVGLRYRDPIPVGDGLLDGVRLGQNTTRNTRVVLDLERYGRHRLLHLSAPARVVIDVFGPRGAPPALAPPPAGAPQLPLDVRQVETVVIDPGHGGEDPGAIGQGGVREKEITLRLGLRLRPRLEARGFRVVLTRDRDRTLSLEERTAIAAGSGGDLFVSLHANAAPRRSAHGVETYYLDVSNEHQSLRVVARENGMSPAEFDVLDRTLARLRIAETSQYSSLLAEMVHREVVRGVRRSYRGVEDLGVKKGPFYVLFLSNMPSMLLETGFVTHRDEARRLSSPAYLDAMADAIARALTGYRDRIHTLVARSDS
jgi:N-acetylmuramoyl-L-alanine amidase